MTATARPTITKSWLISDVTNKRALSFAEQGDHSGAQWGASKRRGLAARLFPAAQ